MNEIVETLWQRLYTTGCKYDYTALQNYCREHGFVFHPEHAMSDIYSEEEQRQLYAWLEEHLSQLGDEATIDFFRDYMNVEL